MPHSAKPLRAAYRSSRRSAPELASVQPVQYALAKLPTADRVADRRAFTIQPYMASTQQHPYSFIPPTPTPRPTPIPTPTSTSTPHPAAPRRHTGHQPAPGSGRGPPSTTPRQPPGRTPQPRAAHTRRRGYRAGRRQLCCGHRHRHHKWRWQWRRWRWRQPKQRRRRRGMGGAADVVAGAAG